MLVVGSPDCCYERIVAILCANSRSKTEKLQWRSLAKQLDFDIIEIDKLASEEIKIPDGKTEEQTFVSILSLWVLKNGSNATLEKLLVHLDDLKLKNITDQLRKEFAKDCLDKESALGEVIENHTSDNLLPVIPKYYVPRILLARNRLPTKIFSSQCDDIKVFIGLQRHKLTELARGQLTDTSRSQVYKKQITVRFIILEQKGDWNMLCEKANKPIHLIHHENGSFIWVRSKGSMQALQDAVKCSDRVELTEEDFIQEIERVNPFSVNQTLCIVDSPGMGKSMLLASLGRKLKELFPSRRVASVEMAEWVHKIHLLLQENCYKEEIILNEVANYVKMNHLDFLSELKFAAAKPATKFELIFDGLDEVYPIHVPLALDCLDILRNICSNCARIWVTSRPHLKLQLENRLNILAYNIKPFSESDKISCLTSYWSSTKDALDSEKLLHYAKQSVSVIKFQLGRRSNDIFGVPLQCLLIGEIYEEEANEHADPENIIVSKSEVGFGLRATSIADLFERMVVKKFSKVLKPSSQPGYSNTKQWSTHVYHSLKVIFEEHASDIVNILAKELIMAEDEIINAGFIQFVGEERKARFLHRSFAEYFAAWYFVEIFTSERTSEHIKFLIENILRTQQTEVLVLHEFPQVAWHFAEEAVCYFFDIILLKRIHEFNHMAGVTLGYQPKEDVLSRILKACCYSDRVSILKLLHLQTFVAAYPNQYFDERFLAILVMYSSVDMMQFISDWHQSLPLLSTQRLSSAEDKSFLHAVACQGHFAEFEYLLKYHDFEEMIKKQDRNMSDLVHYCVMHTANLQESAIRQRIQILNVLHILDGDLLEARTELEETPLLRHDVHFLLIQELVRLGANVLAKDVTGRNFLHIDFWGVTQDIGNPYTAIFQYIPSDKLIELVQMRSHWGDMILHNPSLLTNAEPETLKLIYNCGVDINAKNIGGVPVLGSAIEIINRRNIGPDKATKMLKTLIFLGADFLMESPRGNALHIAAANGNVEAVSYFITELGINVNIVDIRNRTPLHHAITGMVLGRERYTVGKFLKELGGILEEPVDRSTLLFDRISLLDTSGVQLLLEETDLNLEDMWEYGMTHLHFVFVDSGQVQLEDDQIDWARLEIIRMLLEGGADVNKLNVQNETPLQHIFQTYPESLTIPQYNLLVEHGGICSVEIANDALLWLCEMPLSEDDFQEMVAPLLIKGGEITCLDEDGNSLIHLAANLKNTERVELLIKKYCLPVNIQNSEGDTPLHEAMRFPENSDNDNLRMFEVQVRKIEEERLATITKLLEYGADVNILNGNNESPLSCYWTTFDMKTERKRGVLGYNARDLYAASPGKNDSDKFSKSMSNRLLDGISASYPFNFNSPSEDMSLINATKFMDLLRIFLMEKDFQNIRQPDDTDNTILHNFFLRCFLSSNQFHNLIELLVEAKCLDAISICGEHHVTSLHIALRRFEVNCDTIELLHSNGVDFDILDENGMSVFWYCIHSKNKPSVIQHLQKYCNWRAPNIHGRNVLHDAVLCRDASTIQILDTDNELRYSIDNNGLTPLHMALQRKIDQDSEEEVNEKLELINNLMTDNPHLRKLDRKGNTILHHAACFLEPTLFHEFTEILVEERFADLFNIPGADGYSSLHYAVSTHETEIRTLEVFSAHGFDFTVTSDKEFSLLSCAIKGGRNLEFLEKLIDLGVDWRRCNCKQRNVLYIFSFLGNVDMLLHFLSKFDHFNINSRDAAGDTLLHYALVNANPNTHEMVRVLLKSGANPNATNKAGKSPLFYAVIYHTWLNKDTLMGAGLADISTALPIIKTMLDNGLDIRTRNRKGFNFIHALISSCKFVGMNTFKMLGNFLVENNCTDLLNERAGPEQETPIHRMILKSWEFDVSTLYLLHKNGVDFDIPDKSGRIAVYLVVLKRRPLRVLEAFMQLSNWKVLDSEGHNIIHYASFGGSISLFSHLLRQDVPREFFCVKNVSNTTPLHWAARRLSGMADNISETSEVILGLLPFYGSEINCQSEEGNTIMVFALRGGRSVSILRQLVKFGADWKITNYTNRTVLHHAASRGRILALRYFVVELKASDLINAADEDGNTPLHCALMEAQENILEMVRILVENGANVGIENKKGESPRLLALELFNDLKVDVTSLLDVNCQIKV